MDTSLNPCLCKEFFLPWLIFHLGAIFGFVGALGTIWCFSQTQIMSFSGFWDEPVDQLVDRKVILLNAVASNLEQLRTSRSVGW